MHSKVELGGNPLLGRIIPLFDQQGDSNGQLSRDEFLGLVGAMNVAKEPEAHYKRGPPRAALRICTLLLPAATASAPAA